MENPTLAQGNEINNLILRNKVSKETIQFLLESGMMANLFAVKADRFSGNHHELGYQIAQARFQMSLGLLPEFEVVHQYYLDTVDPDPVPRRTLNEMFEDRGVKIEKEGMKKEMSIKIQGHMIKPRSVEFSLIRFPVLSRGDRPTFSPGVVLSAAGYINADVYDLVAFSTILNAHIVTSRPVCALNSVVQTPTSSTGGGWIYHAHPTLHGNMQKQEVWFNRLGLKDMDYWTTDHHYLVRSRDHLARSPKI